MQQIHILPPHIANQIAAGEVVERPASIVKELVENSIDAGATQIYIELEEGGTKLIRVTDNGLGIAKEDIPLAIKRHATSKIHALSDLEHIASLGFRGEALASIASVAKLTLTSNTGEQTHAWQIAQNPLSFSEAIIKPAAHPIGTTIEVRDLFYNTPARRKFLRTERTEFTQCEDMLKKLALSRFSIAFTLRHNQKTIYQLSVAAHLAEQEHRISHLLLPDFIKNAIFFENSASGLELRGWVGIPTYSRSQADLQYCYINGRIVRDKTINHAIRQAYQDVLFQQRFPTYLLFLEIDPAEVDVNVHPTKHEVRFRESKHVYEFVKKTIEKILEKHRPQHQLEPSIHTELKSVFSQHAPQQRSILLPPTKQPEFETSSVSYNPTTATPSSHFIQEQIKHYQALHISDDAENNTAIDFPFGYAIAELHGVYILAENKQGLIIVDMHAAHERILYEKLKVIIENNSPKSQILLLPITIDTNQQNLEIVEEHRSQFSKMGFNLERMGPQTLVVREIPELLHKVDIKQLIIDVLADLRQWECSERIEEERNKILQCVSCHSAVRANRKLSIPEMNQLLRELENCDRQGQCNHGRPTWRQISLHELDSFFKRGR